MFRITDIKYAKDIRLNNAKEIISKKLRAFIENTIMNYKDIYKKTLPYNMEIQIMDLLQNFIAFFIVSAVSIKKAYGVGTFTMLSSAITNFYLGISLIVKSTSNIYKSMDYLKDYISFVNKTDTSTDTLELQPSFRKCFVDMWNKLYTNQGTVLEPLLKALTELAASKPDTEEIEKLDNEIHSLSEQSRILNQVMKKGYMDSALFMEKGNQLAHGM